MRIALLSFNHSESTIPLAKNLASDTCIVDFYYIFNYKSSKNIPGFDISNSRLVFGLNKLSVEDSPETFKYIGDSNVNLYIIYTPPRIDFLLVRELFLSMVIFKINSRKYDFVNIVGQNKLSITYHNKLSCTQRIHTLHEVTDHFNNKNLNNPLLNYLFDNKIKIIVHSEDSLKKIRQYKKCIKESTFKIHFGLFDTYLNYEPNYLVPTSVKYILFFGLIRSYKGLDILLAAINILKDENIDVKFVIAGYGNTPEMEDLKKNEKCIVINRHLNNEELVGLNKAAQFIVCPYKSASQSGIIMTTFLFGRPIIASDVGAFSEVITNGVNGILVKPNSPEELAAAIFGLFSNLELYKKMQAGVDEFAGNTNFNWVEIAKKTKEIYLAD